MSRAGEGPTPPTTTETGWQEAKTRRSGRLPSFGNLNQPRRDSASSADSQASNKRRRITTETTENQATTPSTILFRFTLQPPNQLVFSKFLTRAVQAEDITNVAHLRDGTGYIVRGAATAIEKLKTIVQSELPDNEFTTHVPKQQKKDLPTTSFVICNVPTTLSEEDIQQALTDGRNSVTAEKVLRITSRALDKPTRLVRVFVKDAQQALTAISGGIRLGLMFHRCEASHEKPQAKQCYNCLSFGHEARDCKTPTKCIRCGEHGHKISGCTVDKADARCANCSGAHSTAYKGCPAHKEAQKQAEAALPRSTSYAAKVTSAGPAAPSMSPSDCATIVADVLTSLLKTHLPLLSYSAIINTVVQSFHRHGFATVPEGKDLHDAITAKMPEASAETQLPAGTANNGYY